MELFGTVLKLTMNLFCMEFTLLGFTFSFWQVFVFSIVAGIVGWILGEVLIGD